MDGKGSYMNMNRRLWISILPILLLVIPMGVTATTVSHFYMNISSQGGAPVAEFTVSNATPIVLQDVQFTDLSTGEPTSWHWEFDNMYEVPGIEHNFTRNPTMHWHEPGYYNVKLTATNAVGGDVEMKVNYIHVIDEEAPPESYNNSIGGQQIFPNDYIWNVPIDSMPVHANSAAMIATLQDPVEGHWVLSSYPGFPINVVDDSVTPQYIHTFLYSFSDDIPYPIPDDVKITPGDYDDAALIVDVDDHEIYSLTYMEEDGDGWNAHAGAMWDVTGYDVDHYNNLVNHTVPYWGTDAAGMPSIAGVLRRDEVDSGEIRHALRFTLDTTTLDNSQVWPARAYNTGDTGIIPMGTRFRLKEDVDISGYAEDIQVILQDLKTYGMIVADADERGAMTISIECLDVDNPDYGWPYRSELTNILNTDFEVVDSSSLIINENTGQVAP